jgi:hypothetical protein
MFRTPLCGAATGIARIPFPQPTPQAVTEVIR